MSRLNEASADSPALQAIDADIAAAESRAKTRKAATLGECVRLQECVFRMGCADRYPDFPLWQGLRPVCLEFIRALRTKGLNLSKRGPRKLPREHDAREALPEVLLPKPPKRQAKKDTPP